MGRFVLRRLAQTVPLLIVISIIGFSLSRVLPNSPFRLELANNPNASEEDIRRLEERYGLDQPLPVQYFAWAGAVVRGDFGRSFLTKRPVMDLILERLPNTMILGASAFLVSILVGIPLGLFCALHRNSALDYLIRGAASLLSSLPAFALGLLCVVLFGGVLRWFPQGGVADIGREGDVLNRLHHLALPALVAGLDGCIGYVRLMRSQTLEVLREDYVRTARAKGLNEASILWRHVFRNALLPVWTGFGGLLARLVGGAALFESVFSWPGIGRLVLESAFRQDYPVILANIMIGAALIIAGYLIVDIGYAWIDPRVRFD